MKRLLIILSVIVLPYAGNPQSLKDSTVLSGELIKELNLSPEQKAAMKNIILQEKQQQRQRRKIIRRKLILLLNRKQLRTLYRWQVRGK